MVYRWCREGENRPDTDGWRLSLYKLIFEADSPYGKYFDVALIATIVLSVFVVMLDSVHSIKNIHHETLYLAELIFTALFTIEYFLRMSCVKSKTRYATSFFGIIDLLAIIPTYLSMLLPGSQYLLIIRILRLLRIFRVLKLVQYLSEAEILVQALKDSSKKITVFTFTVLNLVIILGSMMYVIEGEQNGFTSIPRSIFWAITTLTTVGYGDLVPVTPLGQAMASVVMLLGYSIIAVPTGIVTHSIINRSMTAMPVEIAEETKDVALNIVCNNCGLQGHDTDAYYCKYCGAKL
ncbi:ion transporter [Methanococcoides methylutens]|uniref:Potassium voltage-gated channel subfamily KQT n=1 Tax=Methanococcoides methylutens MM1 TaxID=1434104 RepID=A0A0E3X1C2_METMT|nr:ion transporter [Methanococcoides methylutens]AKB86249.1 Potassium voltage-gated channel subfamily KQT [Methanococcoides methylutens MM1]